MAKTKPNRGAAWSAVFVGVSCHIPRQSDRSNSGYPPLPYADQSADHLVAALRQRNVTPHVAQNTTNRRSAVDRRTTRHAGYAISQTLHKRIEETFGWTKSTARSGKTRHRGLARVDWMFTLANTAYNLVRLAKLLAKAG